MRTMFWYACYSNGVFLQTEKKNIAINVLERSISALCLVSYTSEVCNCQKV